MLEIVNLFQVFPESIANHKLRLSMSYPVAEPISTLVDVFSSTLTVNHVATGMSLIQVMVTVTVPVFDPTGPKASFV